MLQIHLLRSLFFSFSPFPSPLLTQYNIDKQTTRDHHHRTPGPRFHFVTESPSWRQIHRKIRLCLVVIGGGAALATDRIEGNVVESCWRLSSTGLPDKINYWLPKINHGTREEIWDERAELKTVKLPLGFQSRDFAYIIYSGIAISHLYVNSRGLFELLVWRRRPPHRKRERAEPSPLR